jgi:hypothetical protein
MKDALPERRSGWHRPATLGKAIACSTEEAVRPPERMVDRQDLDVGPMTPARCANNSVVPTARNLADPACGRHHGALRGEERLDRVSRAGRLLCTFVRGDDGPAR